MKFDSEIIEALAAIRATGATNMFHKTNVESCLAQMADVFQDDPKINWEWCAEEVKSMSRKDYMSALTYLGTYLNLTRPPGENCKNWRNL